MVQLHSKLRQEDHGGGRKKECAKNVEGGWGCRTLATEMWSMWSMEDPQRAIVSESARAPGRRSMTNWLLYYCPLHAEIVKFKIISITSDLTYIAIYVIMPRLCTLMCVGATSDQSWCYIYIGPVLVLVPSGMMHLNHWIELNWIELNWIYYYTCTSQCHNYSASCRIP